MFKRVRISLLLAGIVATSGWLRQDGMLATTPQTVRGANLTVLEVYRHAQQSLLQPRMLYHAIVRGKIVEGLIISTSHVQELWVAPQRGRARSDARYTYTFTDPQTHHMQTVHGQDTFITTRQGTFRRESPPVRVFASEPQICHGKKLLAADSVLGCPGPTTKSITTVQPGRYAGRPAVVLVTSGTTSGEPDTATTTRLYLDPTTDLPIAAIITGTVFTSSGKYPLHGTEQYGHVFVPAARVARNFFKPSSIGYQPPAVTVARRLNHLPADFTPYWLGPSFPGNQGLPPLVIAQPGEPSGVGLFSLMYARADNPYSASVLELREFQASDPAPLTSGSCTGTVMERLTLAAGTAKIFTTHGLHACAFFKNATIMVVSPFSSGIHGTTQSPYNSKSGMEVILRALQPRTPAGRS